MKVGDRLVALAAAGQETAGTQTDQAERCLWVSGGISEVSYPVTLGGLDGLLTGRGARTHAVSILAVRGVSVGLALSRRSRASLDLVRVLTGRRLARFSREGERARPAGWRAWH